MIDVICYPNGYVVPLAGSIYCINCDSKMHLNRVNKSEIVFYRFETILCKTPTDTLWANYASTTIGTWTYKYKAGKSIGKDHTVLRES